VAVVGKATGAVPDEPSRAFRERARLEADRYGPDPWIFVRELLQNARDAGADQVKFSVSDREVESGQAAIVCHDNGEGMTFEHARRYLFALYASSKEGKRNQAGKFGVGFWSVLRFEPSIIVIRSRPRRGQAWGLALDGKLENVVPAEPPTQPGTEIILRRPPGHPGLEDRIYDAVWQSARYLIQRDDPEASVEIRINGRPVNADFALPAPSATFHRGGLRGVVGLGPAPRVELFSRGLRVRSAACLEDLLAPSGRHTSWLRVQFAELSGGLAPAALLESADLEIMLSRSEARDNRALGKLVKLAQREIERLIERQLEMARPLPWWIQLRSWLAERLRALGTLRLVDMAAVGMMIGVLVAVFWWRARAPVTAVTAAGPPSSAVAVAELPLPAPRPQPQPPALSGARPFEDLRRRYSGPEVDALPRRPAEPIALRYRPAEGQHYFAALTFTRLAPDGAPLPEEAQNDGEPPLGPYATTSTCEPPRCLEVEVELDSPAPTVRIPVPTGHRIVAGSVTLDGARPQLRATAEGQPVVVFEGPARGLLRYRTAATADLSRQLVPRAPASLPARLERRARRLRPLPISIRVAVLIDLVRERVTYDDSPPTVRRHRQLRARGQGFIRRTLAIGAGDCDVQSSVLTGLMHAAGVPARMAVGYQGALGQVLPSLHAWVEYLDADGRWLVADATASAGDSTQLVATAAGPSGGFLSSSSPRTSRPRPSPPSGGTPTEPVSPENALPTGQAPSDAPGAPGILAKAGSPTAASQPPVPLPEPAPEESAPSAPAGPAIAARPPGQEIFSPRPELAPPAGPSWLESWPFRLCAPLLLLLAGWSLFGRTRRVFKLDRAVDLARLLNGVLQQPEAFGHIGALLHRPLVPLANGKAISLMKARELASRGRLFCTTHRPALASGALRAGAVVLDHQSEEGKVVADALAAVDLDAWSTMLDGAATEPLLDGVNRLLRQRGEEWAVKTSAPVPGGLAALDIGPLGARFPGIHGSRLVLVDAEAPWLAEARWYHQSRPRAAIFMAVDQLAMRLGLPDPRRAELLGDCAREAILESFGAAR
jgi:hypothetical protein